MAWIFSQFGFLPIFFLFDLPIVAGQNYTACNPTNTTCPPIPGYSSTMTTFDFKHPYPDGEITWFSENTITRDDSGLHITLNSLGEDPFIVTDKYIFYGKVTATFTATNATSIGTYFNMQADDIDEIDWQLNGDQGSAYAVYYSKANLYNATEPDAFDVASPHTIFHNYSIDWNQDRIEWIIDDITVATVTRTTAGATYPQLPVRISIGIWCPECFSSTSLQVGAPITDHLDDYVLTLTYLEIINYNPATQYAYNNMSGLSSSVLISPPQTPSSSKISGGVIAGIVVGSLVCIIVTVGVVTICYRRRRTSTDAIQNQSAEVPSARTHGAEVPEVINPSYKEEHVPTILRYPEAPQVYEPDPEIPQGLRFDRGSEIMTEKYPLESPLGGRLGGET